MGATLLSKILGVVRDIAMTGQFGASDETGAYQAAFRIPDTLFLLIMGGALGSALIPVFSKFLGQNERRKAWELANTIVNYAFIILTIFAALAWIFAPFIVDTILAPNFAPPVKELTINLTRLLLLQPFFLGLGGIAWALLNGLEDFLLPAIVPLIYNLSIVLGIFLLKDPFGIYGPAYGVIIGALLYLVVQLPKLFKLGFFFRPTLKVADGAKQVFGAVSPRIIGQAAFQANFFVATALASGLTNGATQVAIFGFSYQLFMLPHSLFAWSIATASFPVLSRMVGAGDFAGYKQTVNSGLRQIIFLMLPASVGLAILSNLIVTTLFEAGRFTASNTQQVGFTLFCFSFGLLFYGIVEIMTRAYFALQDSWTPVIVAVPTFIVNLIASIILVNWLNDVGGLALGLAISTFFEMICLVLLLQRKIGPLGTGQPGDFLKPVLKMGLATTAMGLALFGVHELVSPLLDSGGKLAHVVFTPVLVAFGGGIYLGLALLLKISEIEFVVKRLLRRR